MKKFDISLKPIEPLLENIGDLPKGRRILICAATFIVLIGSFFYFSYLPKFENLNQLNSEYKSLEQRLASAKKRAAQLSKYRENMKMAETKYRIARKVLPDKK